MPTHDAPVPLAEICGGLPAASPLLGTPGEVAWFPTTALPGIWVSSPGGLAQCPLVVPSVDRGASVSVVGVWGLGEGSARADLSFVCVFSLRAFCSSLTMSGNQKMDAYNQDRQDFIQHFSQIVKVLTEDEIGHPETGDAITRLKEVLEYNAVGGKCNRGLTVLQTFRELVEPRKQDAESLQRALTVGWCVELLQAFFLVADDIMDSSLTRRGQICWYQKPGIGLDAINDTLLLESCVYRLLRFYCKEQPYYLNLLELFLQCSYRTEIGQTLDLVTAPQGHVDLDRYTEKRYKAIVKYKTAFYSFYLPIAAAMYMAGIDGEKEHANALKILLEMGEFFQIQDDYLDLFGDPSVTGKVGTDIQDNKCSWLVVQCLQRATPQQRQILQENYGQKAPEKVAQVKALYEALDLQAVFFKYEEESYNRLKSLIEQYAADRKSVV